MHILDDMPSTIKVSLETVFRIIINTIIFMSITNRIPIVRTEVNIWPQDIIFTNRGILCIGNQFRQIRKLSCGINDVWISLGSWTRSKRSCSVIFPLTTLRPCPLRRNHKEYQEHEDVPYPIHKSHITYFDNCCCLHIVNSYGLSPRPPP